MHAYVCVEMHVYVSSASERASPYAQPWRVNECKTRLVSIQCGIASKHAGDVAGHWGTDARFALRSMRGLRARCHMCMPSREHAGTYPTRRDLTLPSERQSRMRTRDFITAESHSTSTSLARCIKQYSPVPSGAVRGGALHCLLKAAWRHESTRGQETAAEVLESVKSHLSCQAWLLSWMLIYVRSSMLRARPLDLEPRARCADRGLVISLLHFFRQSTALFVFRLKRTSTGGINWESCLSVSASFVACSRGSVSRVLYLCASAAQLTCSRARYTRCGRPKCAPRSPGEGRPFSIAMHCMYATRPVQPPHAVSERRSSSNICPPRSIRTGVPPAAGWREYSHRRT